MVGLDASRNEMSGQSQVVCIAGGSRGIGKAVAESFAHCGAKLLLLARSQELQTTALELGQKTETMAQQCDLGEWTQVQRAVDQALQKWGHIDVLVNTAAVLGPTGDLWRANPESWGAAQRVNLLGLFHSMRAVLPAMVRARQGKIINFAGGGAAYGYPGFSSYAASKAAVVRLTETVALECLPHNIQINAVAPGAIETRLLSQVRAAGGEIRTLGSMEEAVSLVLFLASPASNHITGRFIHARDGYREFQQQMPAELYKLRRVEA